MTLKTGSSNEARKTFVSGKQRDLILKIVEEHRLDKQAVEGLAKDMFQKLVKTLNKLEASGLIEELLAKFGPAKTNGGKPPAGTALMPAGLALSGLD